jgi:putative spermidine/putrescine transport system substrate-binding protein
MSKFTNNIVAIAAMSAFTAGNAFAADLTVVSWGGAYTKSQVEAYHKPWMASTGHNLISEDYGGGLAEIKAQVESGNVTWDVVDVELADVIRGCDEGLLEPIDHSSLLPAPDGTPAVEDFAPGTLFDCGVASIVWSSVYVYDTSKVRNWNAPKTMADFFNTTAYPGKRGMRKSPKVTLEFALIADGVPTSEVYNVLGTEEGLARAFAKLDTIKDDVIWWEAGAQPPQLLADGEVIFTTAWNGRIFNAVAAEGQTFEMVWDGQVYDLDLWVIPKGTKNLDAALDFVRFSTATEQLAAQASWIPYGPARKSSVAVMGTYHSDPSIQMADHMPTAPANFKNALQNDFEFWADNSDELNERFNSWLAK